MEPPTAGGPAPVPAPPVFTDGLGERYRTIVRDRALEVLTLREVFCTRASFEPALRERVSRLAGFRHERFARVLGVERLDDRASTLGLVSEHVTGMRLSALLAHLPGRRVALDLDAALCMIHQLVSALAALHERAPEVCHGAVAPERIVLTQDGRLVIVEHVFGSALEHLQLSHQRYWTDLRVALPPIAGAPRFDRRTDVTQAGATALALVLGRPLTEDDYPTRLVDLVGSVEATSSAGQRAPLPPALRRWLGRTLQIDRRSFSSIGEAQAELDRLLDDHDPEALLTALRLFLHRYNSRDDAGSAAGTPEPRHAPVTPQPAFPATATPPRTTSVSTPPPTAVVAPAPAAVATPEPKFPRPIVPAPPQATEPEPDPIAGDIFGADEASLLGGRPAATRMWKRVESSRKPLIAAAILLALLSAGLLMPRSPEPEVAEEVEPETGTLSVSTTPAGAEVLIDGQQRGVTPLVLQVAAGDHTLEVVANGGSRTIPVTIRAGAEVSQVIELPDAPAQVGDLLVRSEPSGATVTVDGHTFGRSPVTVDGLTPGKHRVVVQNEHGTVTHEVTVEAGATASLVATLPAAPSAPAPGWISVRTPEEVDVFQNGRLIGSSRSDRIMLPAGRHELVLVNEGLGYRSVQVVTVQPNRAATITPRWPRGTLAVNATPWAEVWIGGRRIGETPIGSVELPVGLHEVLFRHPEFGDRQLSVVVTTLTQARVSADLRR